MVILTAVIVAATVAGVWWVPRGRPRRRLGVGWLRHPGTWLAVVIGLMFTNQLFFTAYVDQVWHGSAARIARYVTAGWFDLANLGGPTRWLPAWSWTVFRTESALELPFVFLAYLLVCRWFSADVFRRAVHARWVASASFTVTFCLIEWDLRNPYTVTDIAIRVVCGVVTPLLVPLLSEGRADMPRLVPFVASAGALGFIVLAVYAACRILDRRYHLRYMPRARESS